MMKNFVERIKTQEDSMKVRVLSIILLGAFALLSMLIFMSKFSLNNTIIYLAAIGAYLGFGLIFISSLTGNVNYIQSKKKFRRH
ncbi:hypothetical protein [Chryseobacterium sp. FH2]|uniref:hypothetical protein n=1 Tax=Chryseobacterium sp. FH2 TaxID=1674291 RepID=UPI000A4D9257|nr:hypothetical protein [Chryseobacterium sp. FH2]